MHSAENELQNRIQQLEAELAASRAELQEFTYIVSHDLRAPLRHMVSFARLLEEEAGAQLTGESADFLRTITASAAHMGALLDALTALSRLNNVPAEIAPAALAPLVEASVREVRARFSGKPVAVEVRVSEALEVLADTAKLQQALLQVLDNAFKFSAQVPAPSVVLAAAVSPAGRVELRVQDNGAGFPPGTQDPLFRVFGRLHSAKQFPGLGVGLLMAQRLLATMDAHITLAPGDPRGAVATLTFNAANK